MRSLIIMVLYLAGTDSVFPSPSRSAHFVEIGTHRFHVEIADNPSKWSKGLMYRQHMGPYEGMLFVSDTERPQSFWMKNTPLSLDIIFISKDWKIVDIKSKTTPLSEKPIRSKRPAQYILEILGGRSKTLNIEEGDEVRWIKPKN